MPADNGPYETERQARAAAVAAIPPEPNWSILSPAQRHELLHRALSGASVETTAFEDRTARWLATWEDHTVVIIAGWVTRAFEAGKAAGPDGTVTEWGARFRDEGGHLSAMAECGRGPEGEQTARSIAGTSKKDNLTGIVLCREVGPWKEAPEGVTG